MIHDRENLSIIPNKQMKKIIELKQVCKKAKKKVILDNVSFVINEGECIALLGKNGAGKSTVIKAILKLIDYDEGEIDLNIKRDEIGILSQDTKMPEDASVKNLIDFFRKSFPESLSLEEIYKLLEYEAIDMKKMANKFSGGQQRFFDFVLTLIGKPKLIILDEPTAGMDINIRETFWGIIKDLNKNGVTVLFTTHFLEEVDQCDRLVLLNEGMVVADDTPFNIRAKNKRKEVKITSDTLNAKPFIEFMKTKDSEYSEENGLFTFVFNSDLSNLVCKKMIELDVDMEDVEISNSSLLKTLLNEENGGAKNE